MKNPTEMVGTWELVDVSGDGSLEGMMQANAEETFYNLNDGVIALLLFLIFCPLFDHLISFNCRCFLT